MEFLERKIVEKTRKNRIERGYELEEMRLISKFGRERKYVIKKSAIKDLPISLKIYECLPTERLFDYKWSKIYAKYMIERVKILNENWAEAIYKFEVIGYES